MQTLSDTQQSNASATAWQIFSKVPAITLYFWIVKIFCTTIGETAADYLNMTLKLGLTGTTVVMSALLVIALFVQFRVKKYIPTIYWLAVVLISVVGTLITDNLTDNLGVSLVTSTLAFSAALIITFAVWYTKEKTLSIHSIYTLRREAFYWLAILFTFALGTAAGDLAAERLSWGYLPSGLIFGGLIAIVAVAHWRFKLDAIWAFWMAYILTRPLGASVGDYLSQARSVGGLGLGTVITTAVFLSGILVIVSYLAITKRDVVVAQAEV